MVTQQHIIWAEDYPYVKNQPIRYFLGSSVLTDEEKYLIARGNAERIYKLAQ